MRVRQCVRRCVLGVLFFCGVTGIVMAQTPCSGKVTGPGGKTLPAAHVSLLAPTRASVLQIVKASTGGAFELTIPHSGYWVLRFAGVGYDGLDVALYVPDAKEINLTVALGSHFYLEGQPELSVIGDFNLWKIPSAVPLKRGKDGVYTAEIPVTTDSIAFRIRGYRDGDGVEGIRGAVFVLNREGSYDARIKTSGGLARVVVDTRLLDHSSVRSRLRFAQASRQTKDIALAVKEWWDQENAYFANQMAESMERKPLHNAPRDWGAYTARMFQQEEAERDSVVRAVRSLAYLSAAMKSRTKDRASITKALGHLPATSPAWALNPVVLSTAVRSATWSDSVREDYVHAMIEHNPERAIRLAVLLNEFMIALDTDKDAKAARYYDILTAEYADTPEAKEILKKYKRPEPSEEAK
jgi:hypothetical protein